MVSLDLQVDCRGEVGTACVTLFKKMRPFNNSGVFFFFGCPGPPGKDKGAGTVCFFRRELLLPTFCLPFCGSCKASLQHRMIFSNKKTWYSRSTSDFVTRK